ncbi:probable GIR2 Highly acidic protein with anomalous electrophoretic behavior [Rhynchosporium agropyri]|uniref:Probable GIR2 Highly acidic protein with anomalous electrophoretic behavior n=1 Tax=Rhynchosporium agropyri TaxID=914238 RepID=A0A1E1LGV2_9HELO|nr:probable GIR2 Highly acidic protein with anomalous electrophoretic behavior [Rhynchosporium agropyri]
MGREEQKEEREVLDSIFPEEIQDISETEFRISVLLDITNDDDDDSEPPTVILQVKYPEDYPEEPPVLDLLTPQNAPTHTYFNVASDKDILLDGVKETIEENMGMAMIFTIYSTLKDNAEQLVAERQAAARAVHEENLMILEQEENKKFHGTPVTPETFTSWRKDFRKEMEEQRLREEEADEAAEKKKNRGRDAVVQLTGRQLWEKGLAGKIEDDDDDDDEDEDNLPAVEKLKVEA